MFVWRYLDDDDLEIGTSERFADRASAEEWMGAAWADLLERGIDRVVLMDERSGQTEYVMPLGPDAG